MGKQLTDEDMAILDELKTEVKGLYDKSDKKNAELAEQINVFKGKMVTGDDLTDIKNRIDEQKNDLKSIYEKLDAAEAKMAKSQQPSSAFKSMGQRIVESKGFEDIGSGRKGTWDHVIEAKDITNAGNYAASPSRNVLVPEENAPMLQPINQPLGVRSLIPSGQTSRDVIQRAEEDVFTNNADMVAEGGTKPESNITFKRGVIPVEKIAHWIRCSSEVLDDVPMLRSYIDTRLAYGVNFKEEQALLTGNGTSPQLDGLFNTGNFVAYNNAFIGGVTPVDGVDDVRIAKEQVNGAFLSATGVIMNYKDWAKIELLKNGDGQYLHASVTSGLAPRLWGMRVVPSHSIAEGKFHVGAYAMGAMIWDRWALRIMASTEDGDNFKNNLVTILAEKRLALEVYRPQAFVYGDFTVPAP